jgi:cell division septation protein DedD
MRNNETGEFELVVGNRQIMSGFFIVVLLFAVGVAMGYFLGQNSPRSAKLVSGTAATVPASAAEARPQAAAPAHPPTQEAPPPETATQQPATATQPATQPVREPETAAPGAASSIPEAAAGTYWQVMAVNKDDAEVVIRTLKNKGFPATLSPGTKGLTRVLVGPYADRAALGRAKADLETAGLSQGLYKIEISGDQGRK